MRLMIFLFIFLNTTLSFCQSFSVESIVNKHNWKNGTRSNELFNYTKNRLSILVDSLREKRLYRNQSVSIIIPNELAKKSFSIHKGDTVIQIYKGEITGEDIISGFESVMDGNGNIKNYFLLEKLKNRHPDWFDVRENPKQKYCYFYVIGARDVQILNPLMVSNEISNNYLMDILNSIEKEMLSNKKFEYYIMKLPNITSKDSIKSHLLQFCDFQVFHYKINNDLKDDYIIQVNSNNYKKTYEWEFSVIMCSSFNTPVIIPFSNYEFSFISDNKIYFLLRRFVPETGARGRDLYTYNIKTKKMEVVFSDWTWSD